MKRRNSIKKRKSGQHLHRLSNDIKVSPGLSGVSAMKYSDIERALAGVLYGKTSDEMSNKQIHDMLSREVPTWR